MCGGGFLGLDPAAYSLCDGCFRLGAAGGLGLCLALGGGEGGLGLLGGRSEFEGAFVGLGQGALGFAGALTLLAGGVLGGDAMGLGLLGGAGVAVGGLLGGLLLLVGVRGELGVAARLLLGLLTGLGFAGGIGQGLGGGDCLLPRRLLGRDPLGGQFLCPGLELGDPGEVRDGALLGVGQDQLRLLDAHGVLRGGDLGSRTSLGLLGGHGMRGLGGFGLGAGGFLGLDAQAYGVRDACLGLGAVGGLGVSVPLGDGALLVRGGGLLGQLL